jgi:biotin operon repressor
MKLKITNKPVRQYLHVPLEMSCYFLTGSTVSFNEYKTYLCIHFFTSGNIKLNNGFVETISNELNISTKTIKKHIDSLIKNKFLGYNPNTNTLFVNGLDKARKHLSLTINCENLKVRLTNKLSFVLYLDKLKNLKEVIFAAKESHMLNLQFRKKNNYLLEQFLEQNKLTNDYKLANKSRRRLILKMFRKAVKLKREPLKDVPNQFNLNLIDNENNYLGISNDNISKQFRKTKSWGCKLKYRAKKHNFLLFNKMFKLKFEFPANFNVINYLSINDPLNLRKYKTKRFNDKCYVFECLYDNIESYIIISHRKSI